MPIQKMSILVIRDTGTSQQTSGNRIWKWLIELTDAFTSLDELIIIPEEPNEHNSRISPRPGQIHSVPWMAQQSENIKGNNKEGNSRII